MYVGVTNNLERRLYEHKHELIDGFTKKYHIHKLVYYEQTNDIKAAIEREKQIKGWVRTRRLIRKLGLKNVVLRSMSIIPLSS